MKIICPVCELWLVEPVAQGGLVTYWCERCAQSLERAPLELKGSKWPNFTREEKSLDRGTVII